MFENCKEVEELRKNSKNVPMHLTASERASERVRTCPNVSKHVRKLPRVYEKLRKPRANERNLKGAKTLKRPHKSDASASSLGLDEDDDDEDLDSLVPNSK